jgi:transcriptional regulator with XRE-family HTH domain
MSSIGERIKRIRENKNYTQEHLAGKLGISQNTYSKLETGGTKLTTDRLQEIADILEVPIEEILCHEQKVFNFHNNHIALGYIENLQEDNRELVKMLREQIAYL